MEQEAGGGKGAGRGREDKSSSEKLPRLAERNQVWAGGGLVLGKQGIESSLRKAKQKARPKEN